MNEGGRGELKRRTASIERSEKGLARHSDRRRKPTVFSYRYKNPTKNNTEGGDRLITG